MDSLLQNSVDFQIDKAHFATEKIQTPRCYSVIQDFPCILFKVFTEKNVKLLDTYFFDICTLPSVIIFNCLLSKLLGPSPATVQL